MSLWTSGRCDLRAVAVGEEAEDWGRRPHVDTLTGLCPAEAMLGGGPAAQSSRRDLDLRRRAGSLPLVLGDYAIKPVSLVLVTSLTHKCYTESAIARLRLRRALVRYSWIDSFFRSFRCQDNLPISVQSRFSFV